MRINPEKKEDRERVANSLLRVTLKLANEHGFVSLGLREVSRAADIAPTSFYRHFADMEVLGRDLIESLAGPFIEGWVTRAAAGSRESGVAFAVGREALGSANEDPELMRFILAERRGAIPSFRSALAAKLTLVSTAVGEGVTKEASDATKRAHPLTDAIVVLILEACGDLLDRGGEHTSAVSERLDAQIHMLLAGAASGRKK